MYARPALTAPCKRYRTTPDHRVRARGRARPRVRPSRGLGGTCKGRRRGRRPYKCKAGGVTSSAAQPRSRRPSLRGSRWRGSVGTTAPSDRPSSSVPAHTRADGQRHGREQRQNPSELRQSGLHDEPPSRKDVALLGRQPGGLSEIPGFASPPRDGFAVINRSSGVTGCRSPRTLGRAASASNDEPVRPRVSAGRHHRDPAPRDGSAGSQDHRVGVLSSRVRYRWVHAAETVPEVLLADT